MRELAAKNLPLTSSHECLQKDYMAELAAMCREAQNVKMTYRGEQ
jgi:hypothetical protein